MDIEKNSPKYEDSDKILILSNFKAIDPGESLTRSVMAKIEKRRLFLIKRKILAASALFASFIATSSIYWSEIIMEIKLSGTYRLYQIFLTDYKEVVLNWKYFSLYFLETLPVMSILFALTGIFLVLLFIKALSESLPKTFSLNINHQ
jgi:hypothetical protein